jgi:hypothetical protein
MLFSWSAVRLRVECYPYLSREKIPIIIYGLAKLTKSKHLNPVKYVKGFTGAIQWEMTTDFSRDQ